VARATALIAILVVLPALLGGCGGDGGSGAGAATEGAVGSAPANVKTPSVLRDLNRRDGLLTAEQLSMDALEPDALASKLESSGYAGGREAEWTGRTDAFNHVVVRTLAFEGGGGDAYVAWLEEHTEDLLGTVGLRADLPLDAGGRLYRDGGCNCHSDLPTFLAAWEDGDVVHTVLADGPDVDRERFLALVRQLG
jgi:hypothetical protein